MGNVIIPYWSAASTGPVRIGLIASGNLSWTNHFWGGNNPIVGDGSMEFKFGDNVTTDPQIIVGIDTVNPGTSNPNACTYNFYWLTQANELRIRSNGSNLKIITTVNLTDADVLKIERSGTDIQFWVKGVLEHTATGATTNDMYAFGTMSQCGPVGRFTSYAMTVPIVEGTEITTFSSIDGIDEYFG